MSYIICFLILTWFGIVVLLWSVQERFIFFPTKLSPDYQFSQFEGAEEVFLPVSDRVTLHGLFFKVGAPTGAILYFHGNSEGLESWGYAAAPLTDLGYEVLMPDYRGFGKSGGRPDKGVLHEDADLWYAYLLKLYSPKDIVLYGRSLGTGIACSLATRQPARQLILETPYLSILSIAKSRMPFMPVYWLLKYHMRNDLNIKNIKCPVHLFHGTADEVIPYHQAFELAEIQGDPEVLTTIEGGMHGNLLDFALFRKRLRGLLSS